MFTGIIVFALGGRSTIQYPPTLPLFALLWSVTVMNIVLIGPEKDGCGVRLNVTVRLFPDPETVLEHVFAGES